MAPEAITEYKAAVDKSNRVQLAVASLARAYVKSGNQFEARKLLTELEERSSHDFISPYLRATVYVALNEKQRAIELLEEAYAEHSIDIASED
jgi:predicted Zn-dependent protease